MSKNLGQYPSYKEKSLTGFTSEALQSFDTIFKKGGSSKSSKPIFWDPTGKRWRRSLIPLRKAN